MIYIDNPVGAGFSFADPEGIPSAQSEVADDLYEFLVQAQLPRFIIPRVC